MTDYKRLRDGNEALRAAIVADIAAHPDTTLADIAARLNIGARRACSLLGSAKKRREVFCWDEYRPNITHWRTSPTRPPKKKGSPARVQVTRDDLDWMAYWRLSREERRNLEGRPCPKPADS